MSKADVSLSAVEAWVKFTFDVEQMSVTTAKQQLDQLPDSDWIVIDVRELEEYQVSHLRDAINWQPSGTAEDFLAQHEPLLNGKNVLVYCSVGYRSSKFADELNTLVGEDLQVYNLQGGIFRWFNEGLPVYSEEGASQQVHPYNKRWGRLLNTNHP